MRSLFFVLGIILYVLVGGAAFANVTNTQFHEEDMMEVLTTEEKIENVQGKMRDTKNRYRRAERQYERWQNAEDMGDYMDVIGNIKIFN